MKRKVETNEMGENVKKNVLLKIHTVNQSGSLDENPRLGRKKFLGVMSMEENGLLLLPSQP